MRRDRFVQLVALAIAAAMLTGAAALSGRLVTTQNELQLRYASTLKQEAPPLVQVAVSAGGLARGLLVQYLWYRANEAKQAGQFYDANTLSEAITTLQPRFPQVWAFRAWDMAYNISVATHTPAERWDWVNKGIRLLRDEGIPFNPRAVRLHRELAWIFIHKVGQFTDDMHWYYKRELAREWQEVMGAPTVGATTEQVIEDFKRILNAPDDLATLTRDTPGMAELLSALRAIGREPGEPLLREINRVYMYNYSTPRALPQLAGVMEYPRLFTRELVDILHEAKHVPAVEALLASMRKRVLINTYHMDPNHMLAVMEEFGPMDWRHPAAHSAYWGSLGVDMAESLREKHEVDVINTHRLVIHSMQLLMRGGDLVYDPITGYIDQTPDVRFIPAYEAAFDRGRELVESGEYISGTETSFKKGHENFLAQAMVFHYFYGNRAEAQRLFDKTRQLYGEEEYNRFENKYDRTLDEMVIFEQRDNIDTMQGARQAIDGYIEQAVIKGLLPGRMDTYRNFERFAHFVHEQWTSGKLKTINLTTDQGRMIFADWPQPVYSGYIRVMRSPNLAPSLKLQLWRNTLNLAPDLALNAYDQVRTAVGQQLEQAGYDPQADFPAPEGIEQFRQAQGGQPRLPEDVLRTPLERGPGTVQRQ